MEEEIQHLLELAARVARGESGAAEKFRQALEPYLRSVAWRALLPDARLTAKTYRVQAEAERLPNFDPEGSALAEEVARSFCARAIRRLQPSPLQASPLTDTVVNEPARFP